MNYLLDTNVLSEQFRRTPDAGVVAWLRATPAETLSTSVVTIGEIERGIARLTTREPERAKRLAAWLEGIVEEFQDRIVPMDRAIARTWGRMTAATPGLDVDAIIAATAAVHGMTIVTRNVRDLERFGVPVFNPFSPSA